MNSKKNTPKKYGIWTLVVTALVTFVISGGGVYLYMNTLMNARVHELNSELSSYGKIGTVYNTIYNSYYKHVSRSKLEQGAINGMLNALDDPFSEYMNKTETQSLNDTVSGSFSGIGAEVRKNGTYVEIISAIDGTPAQKAGLKSKDILLKINGKSIKGQSLTTVVSKIRGKIGTKVTLTIKRDNTTFDKTIVRASIPVTTVNTKILKKRGKKVGYIQVTQFANNTASEFEKAIKKLRNQGAMSFVIDMRNNPGGLMDQALKMSSMFVKNGQPILQVKGRNGSNTVYRASSQYDNGFKVKEKTVVLINSGSASAAEIFASALHQSANIKLIGTKSYGKGTVQQTADMGKGTELKLTIAKWLTPNGTWIHHKGIKPDIKSDYPKMAYVALISTKKSLEQGQVSSNVKSLQIMLSGLGYFNGDIDGYYGENTAQAVEKFQADNHMDKTGKADKKTILKLEEKVSDYIAKHDPALDTAEDEVTK